MRALFKTNAKYINSPNSELYLKRSNLYGFSHARELYHKTKRLLVVEGYMDVISINKSSLAAAVSPLGTSMSEKQIKLLWSMSKNPTLCFDGDIAGKTAAWRIIKKVIPMITVGYEINFAWLPKGTDPDEMIQKNQKNEFIKIINNTSTLIETIWSMLLDQFDVKVTSSRDQFANLLASAMMTGYFLRQMEQRKELEESLLTDEEMSINPDELNL